jgi:hypothetical protein
LSKAHVGQVISIVSRESSFISGVEVNMHILIFQVLLCKFANLLGIMAEESGSSSSNTELLLTTVGVIEFSHKFYTYRTSSNNKN